ncbi:hypothetical protein [Microtetraspora fusca]|uniref:hypothetical protein n=1 Tax=Microtetraspora fusca TaxID=1997 RepID=UPI00082B5CFC|nr:hypothetical protein [Microtetraspora fusca]
MDVDRGVVYGPSRKALDVYRGGPSPLPAVLLWHGRGPDERDVLEPLARAVAESVPFWLVHGVHDPIVEVERSRRFAAALRGRGWPVALLEVESDHAGVVMTEYAAERGRCVPARDAHAVETGLLTARLIADAAASLPARDPE